MLKGINVYLIGMMGAGKTTIGELLAQELNYQFFDTDKLIEKVAGKTINEIFTQEGESIFREMETKVLKEVASYTKLAIATGGGIVLNRENWSYLHYGLVIWLNAPVSVLLSRLMTDNTRPLLQNSDDLRLRLEDLLQQRENLYSQADLKINIDIEDTPAQIVTRILSNIPSVLK